MRPSPPTLNRHAARTCFGLYRFSRRHAMTKAVRSTGKKYKDQQKTAVRTSDRHEESPVERGGMMIIFYLLFLRSIKRASSVKVGPCRLCHLLRWRRQVILGTAPWGRQVSWFPLLQLVSHFYDSNVCSSTFRSKEGYINCFRTERKAMAGTPSAIYFNAIPT